jgi:hypothetical protein
MQEKRRDRRMPVYSMTLEISSLFKQDNEMIKNLDAPIKIENISRGGIGFTSKTDIPLGYYFNACLQLGKEDAKLYCVIKIIRREIRQDDSIFYGCELVGMAPVFKYIFDEYENEIDKE